MLLHMVLHHGALPEIIFIFIQNEGLTEEAAVRTEVASPRAQAIARIKGFYIPACLVITAPQIAFKGAMPIKINFRGQREREKSLDYAWWLKIAMLNLITFIWHNVSKVFSFLYFYCKPSCQHNNSNNIDSASHIFIIRLCCASNVHFFILAIIFKSGYFLHLTEE